VLIVGVAEDVSDVTLGVIRLFVSVSVPVSVAYEPEACFAFSCVCIAEVTPFR
jgi:hypothetical protein